LTFGRSAGLVFGVVALALSGCGAVPAGLGTQLPAHLPVSSAPSPDGPSALAAAATCDPVTAAAGAPEAGGAAPGAAATGGELERRPEPDGDDLPVGTRAPTFVPTTLEPMPPRTWSYVLARADRAELAPSTVAEAADSAEAESDLDEIEEYDPWEGFNEKMFTFNHAFDKYMLKPVAKGYNFIVPDVVQQMIGHGFDNIRVVPKLVNNVLQGNWKGFAMELGRFVINSTLGIGGLFDIAKQEFGLERTQVDFGQTLGKWGVKPGPFLVLPLMPPLTVRDGIGSGVDGAMDVMGYLLPFWPDRFAMRLGDTVNDRALNLDLFQGFEETTVDLYSAVRNGYLQRRYHLIHGSP
jgi:phospholipid-binding lipoprotein MlaA